MTTVTRDTRGITQACIELGATPEQLAVCERCGHVQETANLNPFTFRGKAMRGGEGEEPLGYCKNMLAQRAQALGVYPGQCGGACFSAL